MKDILKYIWRYLPGLLFLVTGFSLIYTSIIEVGLSHILISYNRVMLGFVWIVVAFLFVEIRALQKKVNT